VKLLFKKPFIVADDTLISRYHPQMPLTVRNPLTNEIIVGEVEFYLLGRDQAPEVLNRGEVSSLASSQDVILKAEFLGTDYNYALS